MEPRYFSLDELQGYDGKSPDKPVLLSVRGMVYDVSPGRSYYGAGGPYNVFAGKECARALALMSLNAEDCSGDLSGLSDSSLSTLREWEAKFQGKYRVVGALEDSGYDLGLCTSPAEHLPAESELKSHNTPLIYASVGLIAALAALVASIVLPASSAAGL